MSTWYDPEDLTAPVSRPRVSRALLADDDEDLRALVRASLERDGYEVVEARDGNELLDRLGEALQLPLRMPDVIITDVMMPKYSGINVLSALRLARWYTPVIVMTALDDENVRERARALGAVAVFSKPFDIDDLRTAALNATLARLRAQSR